MKELKLYREDNGQYSTSEARQDDVSGSYVQKTDYDALRRDNYDQRTKIQQLEIERDELRASVSVLVFAMTKDIDKTGENFRLQEALDKTPSQHLTDIKLAAQEDFARMVINDLGNHTSKAASNGQIDFFQSLEFTKKIIQEYANKLRGES